MFGLFLLANLIFLAFTLPTDKTYLEQCVDRFCPPGTYCEVYSKPVQCQNSPCRPIVICLPDTVNGCNSLTCPSGQVCVEHTIPCIGRSCKKVPKCVAPGTCEAKECPPSHKCIEKDGPKCIRTIFTEAEVALLSKNN